MAAADVSAHPTGWFDPQAIAALGSLDLKARYLVEGFLHGLHQSPFHGMSVEFSEYRDYQPGDDLRHLDWRLFARSDRLCVKKYEQETNVRVYVVVDTSASMGYRGRDAWGSKIDVARTMAAALACLMLRQNDAVGLISLQDGEAGAQLIRPSQKPRQFGLILQHLQRLMPGGGPRLPSLLERILRLVHRRSMVLLFTDLLEDAESMARPLRQLNFQGHECLLFQVLDRDETEFPFSEDAVFEDLETGTRRKVRPAAVKERYLRRFEAFMEAHRQLFRELEIPHSVVVTHQDPWEALSMFLVKRKQML